MMFTDALVVIVWAFNNVGSREGSLARLKSDGSFVIITGPSPWGCGVWGSFPATAIKSVRLPQDTDSWSISGTLGRHSCPGMKFPERWNLSDLNRSIERAKRF